jgi:predicted MPP superfamily phosphohydrolase
MNLFAAMELVVVLVGHWAIGCTVYNQFHANSWPTPSRKLFDVGLVAIVVGISIGLVLDAISGPDATGLAFLMVYRWVCLMAAAFVIVRWIYRRATIRPASSLIEQRTHPRDLSDEFAQPPVHGIEAQWLYRIPGNQIFKPVIEHKYLALRGLPRESDGFRIVQLSDWHFTGKIGIEYYQRIAEISNQLEPDLVVLTGDIVDKAKCLGWLPQTLGRLQSKLGRFYVLGNHDRRVQDSAALRRAIEECGFAPLGGRWHRVEIPGGCLWLCGNELPWFRGAESLSSVLPSDRDAPRVLLAHTPDQFVWAKSRNIDLMLAGHCHGGQIRLPMIGPIITPSRFGVRFASGIFEIGELTMHVSRGICGDDPIRLNCPPEVSVIVLRREGTRSEG